MTRAEFARLIENQRLAAARARPHLEATGTQEFVGLQRATERTSPPPLPPPSRQRVELWFPLPPSWNRTYLARAIPSKKKPGKWIAQVYKSAEAKEYADNVKELHAGVRPWPASVMLRVSAVVAMERAGCDLDDRFKVWLDSLQGIVFDDDEQVAAFGDVRRIVDSAKPGITAIFEVIAVDRYGAPLDTSQHSLPFTAVQPTNPTEKHHDEEE